MKKYHKLINFAKNNPEALKTLKAFYISRQKEINEICDYMIEKEGSKLDYAGIEKSIFEILKQEYYDCSDAIKIVNYYLQSNE